MNCRFESLLLVLPLVVGLAAPSAASSVARDSLADSTVVERWTLANGLRVVTRHVPGAQAVAVTVGYRVGSDLDPPGREGLAQLLGDLGYTAAAGDIPERRSDEMNSLRPLGWSFPVSRRTTLFTEVASIEQFPGVLQQVATRMRGVRFTNEELRAAIKRTQRELGEQFFGDPGVALYFQVREVALDHSDEQLLRRAAGRALDALSVKEVEQYFARYYVPANAVLSLAGNFDSLDVHALAKNLFESIPGGSALPDPDPVPLLPRQRTILRAGSGEPVGAVAIIAPALTDTLHPSFLLSAMLLGNFCNEAWQESGVAPVARYQYTLFDEPDLVRFYPMLGHDDRDPGAASRKLAVAVTRLRAAIVTRQSYERLRDGMTWTLGGPMPPQLLEQARTQSIVTHTLARSQAARALWGGDAFWAEYLRRFLSQPAGGFGRWSEYFTDPSHQVCLVLAPRK